MPSRLASLINARLRRSSCSGESLFNTLTNSRTAKIKQPLPVIAKRQFYSALRSPYARTQLLPERYGTAE